MSIEDWLFISDDALLRENGIRRTATFAPLKGQSVFDSSNGEASSSRYTGKSRSIRNLPFAHNTFVEICGRFQVHDSIVRTLTRSDVPTFSCDNVELDGEALGRNESLTYDVNFH
jgi:hypothetical protein